MEHLAKCPRTYIYFPSAPLVLTKDSHAIAVKRIVRYLIETKDCGLVFKPSLDWKFDYYVDADFCRLWGSEDPNDPIVAKSRTGYVILLTGCPLLWKSSLQTEISVSMMDRRF